MEESPVRFVSGVPIQPGELLRFDDHKVLYRSDTHALLSVVSRRYRVIQPQQILEFYPDFTEVSGFELETTGVLKGGRKIRALARTRQGGPPHWWQTGARRLPRRQADEVATSLRTWDPQSAAS